MSRRIQAQGLYYLVGRLWPLVHFPSFEAVTGPKPDRFVTEAAAGLYTAVGTGLLIGAASQRSAARRVALLTALATAAIELRHRHHIRWVYLADAVVECGFAAGLLTGGARLRGADLAW